MSADGAVGLCLFKMSPGLYLDREGSGLKSSKSSVCSRLKSKTRGASVGRKETLLCSDWKPGEKADSCPKANSPLVPSPHITGPELLKRSFLDA